MNFKKYYIENQMLINEGGVAGHMSHPYDILSIDDFINFYENLLSGNIDASEKVDGVQLTVGVNESGDVVYSRNKSDKPSTDITNKFPITHPGGDAFRAGFEAIKKGFSKLKKQDYVKYDLVDEDGKPKYFLNLEIIYGSVPNLIQYSDINNYIVFHGWFKGPEDNYSYVEGDKSKLNELASKIGTVSVMSDVVTFYGDVGKVKRDVKTEQSLWEFVGPISVSRKRIKRDLEKVSNKWKSFPEVKKLVDLKNSLDKEEVYSLMKTLTAKIGSEVLLNLTSNLFNGTRKTPSNFPKIEGLVTQYKGNTIKITGDFASLNQELWEPLRNGLDKHLKEFNSYILNDVLNVPKVSSIIKQTWDKSGKDPERYLLSRGDSVFYSNKDKLTEKIDKKSINKKINSILDKLDKQYVSSINDDKNVKKDSIIKAIRLGSFKVQQFKEELKNVNNRKDLASILARVMFGL